MSKMSEKEHKRIKGKIERHTNKVHGEKREKEKMG